jgi:hypothetical protein
VSIFPAFVDDCEKVGLCCRQSLGHPVANVKIILLYGAETWKTTKSLLHKLQVFINNYLRRILNIRWPEKISNKELWQKTNQPPVEEELKRRKWRWIGTLVFNEIFLAFQIDPIILSTSLPRL